MNKEKNWGVVYYTFGNSFPDEMENSIESIRKFNKNLPICWITENPNHPKSKIFDYVIQSQSKKQHGWHKRAESLLLSPFDITLQIDSDTIVTGDLSYGFGKAEKFDLAICHAPAYYGKGFIDFTSKGSIKPIRDEQIVYNTGVIFYKKNERVKSLFDEWIRFNSQCSTGQCQCGLSNAMESLNFNPFTLSKSWNFRGGMDTEGHGPVKIWHSREKIPPNKINTNGFFKL